MSSLTLLLTLPTAMMGLRAARERVHSDNSSLLTDHAMKSDEVVSDDTDTDSDTSIAAPKAEQKIDRKKIASVPKAGKKELAALETFFEAATGAELEADVQSAPYLLQLMESREYLTSHSELAVFLLSYRFDRSDLEAAYDAALDSLVRAANAAEDYTEESYRALFPSDDFPELEKPSAQTPGAILTKTLWHQVDNLLEMIILLRGAVADAPRSMFGRFGKKRAPMSSPPQDRVKEAKLIVKRGYISVPQEDSAGVREVARNTRDQVAWLSELHFPTEFLSTVRPKPKPRPGLAPNDAWDWVGAGCSGSSVASITK